MRASRLLPAALGAAAAILLLTLLVAQLTGNSVGVLTRDITTLCAEAGARLPPYTGAIGLLTFMTWASAAALSVLSAVLVPARRGWLLLFAGLLLLLTADDALSLHEEIGTTLGIPEVTLYVVYAVTALVLGWPILRRVLRDRRLEGAALAFIIGGILLATSLGVDQFFDGQHLAEDGPKLLGAASWLVVPVLTIPVQAVTWIRRESTGW